MAFTVVSNSPQFNLFILPSDYDLRRSHVHRSTIENPDANNYRNLAWEHHRIVHTQLQDFCTIPLTVQVSRLFLDDEVVLSITQNKTPNF